MKTEFSDQFYVPFVTSAIPTKKYARIVLEVFKGEHEFEVMNILLISHSYYNRYENFSPNDYCLECLIDENKYFIVSPKDVVAASLYESDDRVKWLIEHE